MVVVEGGYVWSTGDKLSEGDIATMKMEGVVVDNCMMKKGVC